MNIGFERIFPTPTYPLGTTAATFVGRIWADQGQVVLKFKESLKSALRTAQMGRCSFCRRVLFDDYATHIEHFVEKSQYGAYTYEIQNLALSCGTCNSEKNATNRSLAASLKKRAERQGTAPQSRCPTLVHEVLAGAPLPNTHASYRWVHPHFDIYSVNIKIENGWIFVGRTLKGTRTIRGVKLNALFRIEERALLERLGSRGGKLSMLVGAMAELNQHRASEVASAVAKVLRRRRNISAS